MTGVAHFDRRIFLDVNAFSRHTGWLHTPVTDFAKYGVVLFGLLLVIGLLHSRRGTAGTLAAAVWAAIGVLIAVGVNQLVVHAVHRARPYTGHPSVLVLVARSADLSFPSDHAVMAGATATGLVLVWRRLGLIAAVAAAVMAFARVYVGAHYPGDVVAGLILGAVVAGLGWLLVRVPLTRAAGWLRSRAVLDRLLVDRATGDAGTAHRSGVTS
ncbi:MAG: phosphatase PAP2 family protein [bacterium]